MNTKNADINGENFEDMLLDATECLENEESIDSEKETPEESLGSEIHDKSSHGNVITAYLNEIKKWPVVSREKEMALAIAYSEADKKKRAAHQAVGSWFFYNYRLEKNSPLQPNRDRRTKIPQKSWNCCKKYKRRTVPYWR